MHEVHAQPLETPPGCGDQPTVQSHVLAPADAHAQLQTVQAIQPMDAFMVHPPTLAAEHDMDTQIAEPWPRGGDLPNPVAQGTLIPGRTLAIPGRPGKSPQFTGTPRTDTVSVQHPGHQLTPLRGPQSFFFTTSDSICLSSVKSATSLFSRLW